MSDRILRMVFGVLDALLNEILDALLNGILNATGKKSLTWGARLVVCMKA